MRRLLAGFALAGLLIACGGESEEEKLATIAKDVCGELDAAIVLQVPGILADGNSRAREAVGTSTGFDAAMRKECPVTMLAVDQTERDRQERQDAQRRRDNLPTQMSVAIEECSRTNTHGTVRNGSSVTADVYVEVQFLDDGGRILGDNLASVRGIRPGETANWSTRMIDSGALGRCRADVSSAFEQ